jgi:hypothetical protein
MSGDSETLGSGVRAACCRRRRRNVDDLVIVLGNLGRCGMGSERNQRQARGHAQGARMATETSGGEIVGPVTVKAFICEDSGRMA